MGKTTSNRLRIIISSIIGILLLAILLWYFGVNELIASISRASPWWLLANVSILPIMYLLRAWRWNLLLIPVKKSTKIRNTFWSTSVGYMVNTVVPIRLGEFVRAYILGQKENISFAASISSIIVERTLDLIGLLFLGLLMIATIPIGTSIPFWSYTVLIAVATLIGVILGTIIIGTKKEEAVIRFIDKIVGFLPFLLGRKDRILNFIRSLIDGTRTVSQKPKIFIGTIIISLGVWLLQIFAIYFIFVAFNYSQSINLIFLGGILFYFSFIIPAPPGYVGTAQAFFLWIYFFGLGFTGETVLTAMGFVNHLLSVVSMLIVGSIGTIWLGLSFNEIFKMRK